MTEEKHKQWRTEYQHDITGEHVHICITDDHGDWIADCGPEGDKECEGRAEFIALACNLHAELVEALEDLLGDRPSVQGGICQHCGRDSIGDVLEGDCQSDDCPSVKARAAVAKARGAS